MTADSAFPASTPEALPPIVKTVTVAAPPEAAFRRFTTEISDWWPLKTHSVGGPKAQRVEIEPRVGGEIVEHVAGGGRAVWGRITAWEPPARLAFVWHPGNPPETAQDIEIRFVPVAGGTQVTLTHKGFERLGKKARIARRGYPMGWDLMLGLYAERRGVRMTLLSGLSKALMGIARLIRR